MKTQYSFSQLSFVNTPGAHEIEEWALGNGLLDDGKFQDPGIIGPRDLGPNYDPDKVNKFLNRIGEKISVDDEMRLIRELGMDSNGKYEYITIYSNDGTIIHTQEGEDQEL